MRVKVKRSPYRSVKKGAKGTVVQKKFVGTVHEVWRLELDNAGVKCCQLFFPNELEVINGR